MCGRLHVGWDGRIEATRVESQWIVAARPLCHTKYLKLLYLMYVDEIKLPVLKLIFCRVKDNPDFIIQTCQVHYFFVVHIALTV